MLPSFTQVGSQLLLAALVFSALGCGNRTHTVYDENKALKDPVGVTDVTDEGLLVLQDGRTIRPRVAPAQQLREIERRHDWDHEGQPCHRPLAKECVDDVWAQLVNRNGPDWAKRFEEGDEDVVVYAHPELHEGRPCLPHVSGACAKEIWHEILRGEVMVLGSENVDLENVTPGTDGNLEADVFWEFDQTRQRTCGIGGYYGFQLAPVTRHAPRYVKRSLAGPP